MLTVSWELALRADGYAANTVTVYQNAVRGLAGHHREAGPAEGYEGDLMLLGGWRNRAMLDRYGKAAAADRAVRFHARCRCDRSSQLPISSRPLQRWERYAAWMTVREVLAEPPGYSAPRSRLPSSVTVATRTTRIPRAMGRQQP